MTTGIARLRAAFRPDRATLVAYVPILDPEAFDARTLDTYRDAGVAVLEVGIPTRDPWLDGPEVTGSMHRALAAGADPAAITRVLTEWRATAGPDSPAIVWFSYPDLPLAAVASAAAAGALDGLLLLESWRHEAGPRLPERLAPLGVAACAFLPWTPTDADRRAVREATGYVMVQARPGRTGANPSSSTTADPAPQVAAARAAAPGLPVVAGFGIADGAGARRVAASGADGVVVGSALIRVAREHRAEGIRGFLGDLVDALERAT